jgi:hypothetical protein
MRFKKTRARQIWSHLHIWNGRVAVTLGIINGGLACVMPWIHVQLDELVFGHPAAQV